ncbi:hypothetical protein SAMN05720354_107121 [Nitrosospira sp. Nsp1]|nr:hypothetical protein SAMN05720354_107121 [Nitrosospira sp. Nsp1]
MGTKNPFGAWQASELKNKLLTAGFRFKLN